MNIRASACRLVRAERNPTFVAIRLRTQVCELERVKGKKAKFES